MTQVRRWTSADLALFPEDGKRREIINGKMYVSRQPHTYHQVCCHNAGTVLHRWNGASWAGLVIPAPGLVFGDYDDVVPDIVWISNQGLATALDASGHLRAAPELVIEVLSPGVSNERRDREAKLRLYERRGVIEYWIINWRRREVEVYRREGVALQLVGTFLETDALATPVLPGFACAVRELFDGIPTGAPN